MPSVIPQHRTQQHLVPSALTNAAGDLANLPVRPEFCGKRSHWHSLARIIGIRSRFNLQSPEGLTPTAGLRAPNPNGKPHSRDLILRHLAQSPAVARIWVSTLPAKAGAVSISLTDSRSANVPVVGRYDREELPLTTPPHRH